MRVRFTRGFAVMDAFFGTPRETRYALGQVADLPEGLALSYIKNGSAVAVPVAGVAPELREPNPAEIERPAARIAAAARTRAATRPRLRS